MLPLELRYCTLSHSDVVRLTVRSDGLYHSRVRLGTPVAAVEDLTLRLRILAAKGNSNAVPFFFWVLSIEIRDLSGEGHEEMTMSPSGLRRRQ